MPGSPPYPLNATAQEGQQLDPAQFVSQRPVQPSSLLEECPQGAVGGLSERSTQHVSETIKPRA